MVKKSGYLTKTLMKKALVPNIPYPYIILILISIAIIINYVCRSPETAY